MSVTFPKLPGLLDQVDAEIASVTADGAYDGEVVYDAMADRHPDAGVIIPPRATFAATDSTRTTLTRSLGVGEIEQAVQSIQEPGCNAPWRHGFVDVGRGDQLTGRLALGERSAQPMRYFRPGFQNRRQRLLS